MSAATQEIRDYDVSKIRPGMQLGKDILDLRGRILLTSGTVLNEPLIQRLFRLGVQDIPIAEKVAAALTNAVTLESAKVDLLYNAVHAIKDAFKTIEHYGKVPLKVFQNIAQNNLVPIIQGPATLNYLNLEYPMQEYLFNHSTNVGLLSGAIGKWLGHNENEISDLILAGLLHDIGKTKIPSILVNKAGKLTSSEMDLMRLHSTYSYSMVCSLPGISKNVAFAVLQHHERMDGSGYPGHFTADKIHRYGRILAIADSYDAMISNRAYSKKTTPFTAAEILSKDMYSKLDIEICSTFLSEFGQSVSGSIVELDNGTVGQLILTSQFLNATPILRCNDGKFLSLPDFKSITQIKPYPIN